MGDYAALESYIAELKEDRQGHWKPLHDIIREIRQLRFLEHKVDVPAAYDKTTQVVKAPTVPDMLYRVVSTLTAEDPGLECPPSGPTDKAQRNSSLRERWTTAALARMQADIGRPVFRMGMDAACADGIAVWKLVYRPDAWHGLETRAERKAREIEETTDNYNDYTEAFRKTAPFPLFWTDVDPTCYFPLMDAYGLQEVLEITERPMVPTMRKLGVKRVSAGNDWGWEKLREGEPMPLDGVKGSGEKKEFIERWTKDDVTYMFDGKVVDVIKHDSGSLGYYSFAGYSTSSRDPDKAYNSIVGPFKHLIPVRDRLYTMLTNYIYLHAWPHLVAPPDNGNGSMMPTDAGGREAQTVHDIESGSILANGTSYLQPPGASKDLYSMVEAFNVMIDRSGLSAVMYGAGAGTSSGYQSNLLMTASQLVYKPILQNAQMALEKLVADMWRLIEHKVKTKVYVWGAGKTRGSGEWLALGPEDIDGYYAVNVTIKPLMPMDEIAQRDSAIRMHEAGLWGKKKALSESGEAAPEEVLDEAAAERYMEQPAIDQRISQDAAIAAGLIDPPPPQPPVNIYGPGGDVLSQVNGPSALGGIGGPGLPGMGPIQPAVPGAGMPLVPPMPQGVGGPNMPPFVPRGPMQGPTGPPPGMV